MIDREYIIRIAREQGLPETEVDGVFRVNSDDLGRLMAAEREACAKVCADLAMFADCAAESDTIWKCMEAIRARSNNV